jgi:TP901 family phage tail tape measure protein
MATTNNIDIVIRAFDQASVVLGSVEKQLETLQVRAARFQTAGIGMMIAGGLAMAPMLKAISIYSEFEDQLRNVVAITQEFDNVTMSIERYGDAILDVAGKTRFFTTQIAEAAYAMGSRGFRYEQIAEMLFPSTILAQAIHAPLEETTELFLNTIQQFNIATNQLPSVGDMMAKSIADSPLLMERLAKSMKYVGSESYTANESLSDTLATLMALAKQGIYGEKAGTGYRRILQSLIAPTREAQKALEKLGLTVQDVSLGTKSMGDVIRLFEKTLVGKGWAEIDEMTGQFKILAEYADEAGGVLRDLFQIRAAGRFKALLVEGSDAWYRYSDALNNARGIMDEMSKIQNESLVGTWKIFLSNLRAFAIEVAQAKDSALKDFVAMLHRLVTNLRNMGPAFKKVIGSISLFGGSFLVVAGAISLVVGTIMKFIVNLSRMAIALKGVYAALQTFLTFMTANPIGLAILGISAAIGGLVWAFNAMKNSSDDAVRSSDATSAALRKISGEADKAQKSIYETNSELGKMDEYSLEMDQLEVPAADTTSFQDSMMSAGDTLKNRFTWLADSITSDYAQSANEVGDLTNVVYEKSSHLINNVQNDFARSRIYASSESAAWAAAIEKNLGEAANTAGGFFEDLRSQIIEALDLDRFDIEIDARMIGPEDEITPIIDNANAAADDLKSKLGDAQSAVSVLATDMATGFTQFNDAASNTLTTVKGISAEADKINEQLQKPGNLAIPGDLFGESMQQLNKFSYETQNVRSTIKGMATAIQGEFKAVGAAAPPLDSIINDLTTGMHILTSQGYTTEAALSSLGQIFVDLINPTSEGKELLSGVGITAESLAKDIGLLNSVLKLTEYQTYGLDNLKGLFKNDNVVSMVTAIGSYNGSIEEARTKTEEMNKTLQQHEDRMGALESVFKYSPKLEYEMLSPGAIKNIVDRVSNLLTQQLIAYEIPLPEFSQVLEYFFRPDIEIGVADIINEFQAFSETEKALEEFDLDLDSKVQTKLDELGLKDYELAKILTLVFEPVPKFSEHFEEEVDAFTRTAVLGTAKTTEIDIEFIPEVKPVKFGNLLRKAIESGEMKIDADLISDFVGAFGMAANTEIGIMSTEFQTKLDEMGISLFDFLDIVERLTDFDLKLGGLNITDIDDDIDKAKNQIQAMFGGTKVLLEVKAATVDVSEAEITGTLPELEATMANVSTPIVNLTASINSLNETMKTFKPTTSASIKGELTTPDVLAEIPAQFKEFVTGIKNLNTTMATYKPLIETEQTVETPEIKDVNMNEMVSIDSINFYDYKQMSDEELARALVHELRVARSRRNGLAG